MTAPTPGAVPARRLMAALPPEYEGNAAAELAQALALRDEGVVVLDDDPTGTQTVHDVTVLTETGGGALSRALSGAPPDRPRLLYVSTNSRAFSGPDAATLARSLGRELAEASAALGRPVTVISRSDSTLRGHFPGETDALADGLGAGFDGVILCPFFAEGGRLTIGDRHWVADGEWLVPADETEYAKDPAFGYASSTLPAWVEEKTGGRWPAAEVASVSLQLIREGGPEAVADLLSTISGGRPVIINSATYSDLRVAVLGMLQAESAGVRFLCRTAASFVKVRGGVADRPLLRAEEIPAGDGPGIVAAGSYVDKTSRQLGELRRLPDLVDVELSAERAAAGGASADDESRRVAARIDEALAAGLDALVFTSRGRVEDPGAGPRIAECLADTLKLLATRPSFAVLKGGITSHVCVTRWLGAARAYVLGQVIPGVAVWRIEESRVGEGTPVVIFPGNVGGPTALADVVSIMRGSTGKGRK